VEPARYLLDLTNRRGPTGFSDFYLPELSGPENRPAVTRFVMACTSDRRGHVPVRRGPDKRLNGYVVHAPSVEPALLTAGRNPSMANTVSHVKTH
jgi:hypothetical protein